MAQNTNKLLKGNSLYHIVCVQIEKLKMEIFSSSQLPVTVTIIFVFSSVFDVIVVALVFEFFLSLFLSLYLFFLLLWWPALMGFGLYW